MPSIQTILKQYFGHDTFRPLQREIVECVLDRKDCLALLPTGGGKSVCFQVPAMASPGLCLVVSPLIALMKDQVEALRRKNITAFSIHSGMSRKEVIHVLSVAGKSNCKFLYVSPERLETKLFREYLPSLDISLIAVDEAHCISQWGYDFRPSYLRIAALREELPGTPVLALTASATKQVQDDICVRLQFTDYKVFRQSFERPALSYSAFRVPSKINKIMEVLSRVPGSGIVYCRSRKRTKVFSDLLNMHGFSADCYHAGLTTEERSSRQEAWLKDKIRVIVCTNAFGMGIDKPDVRVVIHADTPDCLENYYQEAGRAGRDGKRAYAVLLYDDPEIEALKKQTATRFPPPERIREIYGALMNHLQVASGTGEGLSFELDLNLFIRQFRLDGAMAVSALKTLEQEERLYFNEQVFAPARLHITGDRKSLEDFEKQYPALEPLLKTLLRTYEGILDQPVNIMTRSIAGDLRSAPEKVHEQLLFMQANGIARFFPQKDKPQVFFLQNRVKAEDLCINMESYTKRKEQFEARIASMIDFVYSTTLCRSVAIANYFGDGSVKPCGICDVCLNAARRRLTSRDFEDLHARIIAMTKPAAVPVHDLLENLRDVSKDKVWEVIRFLQSENAILVNDQGWVRAQ